MDASWRYHPTQDGGAPATTIDEIPLDWCMRPGLKLDFRDLPDGHLTTPAEIDAELERIGYELQPFDIVLCNTKAGERFGEEDYTHAGCGFGPRGHPPLAKQGVKIVGTDGWSWDAPFTATAKQAARPRAAPPDRLHRVCFPVKITAASAGRTRCVFVLPD